MKNIIANIPQLKELVNNSIIDIDDALNGEIRIIGLRDKLLRRKETLKEVRNILDNHSDVKLV